MTPALETVGMGDLHAGVGEGEFSCLSVGSGIVVAAYDSRTKIGACAYLILPQAPHSFDRKRPCKYVNTGIAEIVKKMVSLGAERHHIRIALAGGASPILAPDCAPIANLGARNVEAALAAIEDNEVTCVARDVGGQSSRSVFLSAMDGLVRVRTSVHSDRVLCRLRG